MLATNSFLGIFRNAQIILLFLVLSFPLFSQVTESEIQHYLENSSTPISGWQSEAADFLEDTSNNVSPQLLKHFNRWVAKHQGRTNYSGSPSGATLQDLSNFIVQNNLGNVHCTNGGTNAWQQIGPVSNPDELQISGLFTCVALHPNNHDIVYAGTRISGLWKGQRGTDGQFHWTNLSINNSLAALGVTAIFLEPGSQPGVNDVLFIGTFRDYTNTGYGIFKSSDAGSTWQKKTMMDGFPTQLANVVPDRDLKEILNIQQDPNNPQIFYACGSDLIWFSGDGGDTWARIKDEITSGWNTFTFTDIAFGLNSNVAFITGNNYNQVNQAPAKIYRITGFATNNSGVFTDMSLPSMSGVTDPSKVNPTCIDVSSADPDYFYFLVQTGNTEKTIYKLHHNATSWGSPLVTSVTGSPGVMGKSPVFELSDQQLGVNQTSVQVMYSGGTKAYKTIDGGLNWQQVTEFFPGTMSDIKYDTHGDIRGASYVGFSPSGEDIICLANDGGISLSKSSGDYGTWENINDYGLNSLDGERVGLVYKTGRIIQGAWHNGSFYKDLNSNWVSAGASDDGAVFIDNLSTNAPIGYLVNYDKVTRINVETSNLNPIGDKFSGQNDIFRPLVQVSYLNEDKCYIASKLLYLFDAQSGILSPSSQVIYNQPVIALPQQTRISAFKFSSDESVAYIAHMDGHGGANQPLTNHKVYRLDMTSNPPTITNLTANLNNSNISWLAWHHINDFLIDPEDPNIVLACLSDYSDANDPGRIILSVDGGSTWQDISGNLPLIPINKMLLRGGAEIYVATDQGVYKGDYSKIYTNGQVSGLANPNWQCFNNNFPNAVVNFLNLNPCQDELYASTWGYGLFKVKLDPLPFDNNIIEITQNESWDYVREITNSIVVKNNATLTVTSNIYMHHEDLYIEIEPGSELIIDGGMFTSVCGEWLGIYVKGNENLPQTAVNQGKITIINEGKIRFARDAITNSGIDNINGTWEYGTTGGIIHVNGARFTNNRRDIQFLAYRDWVSNNADYDAHFINCNFKRNSNFRSDAMLPSITMWGVVGVRIEDCIFENEHQGIWAYHGGGISSIGATFKVQDNTSYTDREGCSFIGYYNAIRSENTFCGQASKHTEIKRSTFRNNYHSIYISQPSMVRITYNDIEISSQISPSAYPSNFQNARYGIYLDGEGSYFLHNNIIKTDGPNGGIPSVGMVFHNNGIHKNQPYANEIDGFDVGIEAIGRNRDKNFASSGTEFKCNVLGSTNSLSSATIPTAFGNITDIYVLAGNQGNLGQEGVSILQGFSSPNSSAEDLANNLFSSGNNTHFLNSTSSVISYFAGMGNARLIPTNRTGVILINPTTPVNLNSVCTDRPEGNNHSANDYLAEYTLAESELSLRMSQRDSWINGGNTVDLEAQILFAGNQQEYQDLYLDLMDASPFVETELLLNLISITDYPEIALRNVMIANPHASREGEVWDALVNRVPLLSQQTLDDIQQVQRTITTHDILNMQIGAAQESSEYSTLNLLQVYSNDNTTDHTTSIRNHLKNRDEARFRYLLIDNYLAHGDLAMASAELTAIPIECNLTYNEEQEYLGMVLWYEIIEQNLNNLSELEPTEITSLTTLAQDPNGYRYSNLAMGLLELNDAGIEYVEPVLFPGSNSNKNAVSQTERPMKLETNFAIQPNPTENRCYLSWDKKEIFPSENLNISIFNMQGQLIFKIQNIDAELGIWPLDFGSFKAGTYIVEVSSDSGILFSEKVLHNK